MHYTGGEIDSFIAAAEGAMSSYDCLLQLLEHVAEEADIEGDDVHVQVHIAAAVLVGEYGFDENEVQDVVEDVLFL